VRREPLHTAPNGSLGVADLCVYNAASRNLRCLPTMTFVVTENCIKCKFTDCVEVCPVDCFHEGPNMLVIDPDECIDCTLCEPECPAEAIKSEDDLADNEQVFLQLNADLAKDWPVINEMKEPPADAEEWKGKPDKLSLLER